MNSKPTIGIGILSWRAHDTLRGSLMSYANNDFLSLFDQKMIYFSDISDTDRALADEFQWASSGGPNGGIAHGMKNLALNLNTDYILLLQNDNPLVESADFAADFLRDAVALMENGTAHLVRTRHRWHVGEGFNDVRKYLDYFPAHRPAAEFSVETHETTSDTLRDSVVKKLRRLFRPLKARRLRGRGIYIESAPENLYPDVISRNGDFHIIDSSVMQFTDQCLLIKRKFFLDVLMDFVEKNPSTTMLNGFQVPEICLRRPWWRAQHFKIAVGRGLFTHQRYDGSFRANHPAFQAENAKIRA